MNMGAWCLVMFSGGAAAGVGADLIRKPRAASAAGALTALLGGYLGSYTGVLLASTAVPVWARSRLFLGPIFVSTATATGAAAARLALVTSGLPAGHPTRTALRGLETTAILSELVLSTVNERRLRNISRPLREGASGRMFRVAQASVVLGLASQIACRRRPGRTFEDIASLLFLGGGLAFRFAWVYAGRASAADHEAAAAVGRGRLDLEDELEVGLDPRMQSQHRPRRAVPGERLWGELVRRISLGVERRLR
jgi:formate-dependent nitrite reductase membrane component NrfD